MRFNNNEGIPLSEWLQSADKSQIVEILYKYGDEKHAKLIANTIDSARSKKQILTTTVLSDLIREVYSLSRIYDAIRSIGGQEKVNCWLPLSAWRVMALFNDLFRRLPVGTTFNKLFSHQVFDSSNLGNWEVTISFEDAIEKILSS